MEPRSNPSSTVVPWNALVLALRHTLLDVQRVPWGVICPAALSRLAIVANESPFARPTLITDIAALLGRNCSSSPVKTRHHDLF